MVAGGADPWTSLPARTLAGMELTARGNSTYTYVAIGNSYTSLGLRASGNLPVSYVLTGNLPVTYHQLITGNLPVIYHVYFLVISKYIGGDTGAKP